MKNRLLLTFLCGAMSAGLMAQSIKDEVTITGDLTSKIQNADFTQGTPVTRLVRTYDKDMTDNGAGNGGVELFGMQPVEGWTASHPSDNINKNENRDDNANAKAAGLFPMSNEALGETSPGLGGDTYTTPYGEGNVLGFVGVWGSELSYTQNVTLSAGDYLFEVNLVNVAGGADVTKNLIGFIADNGKEYLATAKTYLVDDKFQSEYVVFRLTEETAGKISLGYKAANAGSASMPHIFVKYVKLYSIDSKYLDAQDIAAAKETLLALIEAGEQLGADVTESQKVYDNANATLAEVNAAIAKQKELNEAAKVDLSAYFLKNAHFNLDEPIPNDNGICTYDYDMSNNSVNYYGMQGLTNWEVYKYYANVATYEPSDNIQHMENSSSTPANDKYNGAASGLYSVGSNSFLGGAAFLPPTTLSDGSEEGTVLGFVTCWSGTTQYTQQVTLPKGKYTLALSYYNSGGASDVAKNLIGFIADDGTEHLGTMTAFPVGKWSKEEIMFELDEDTPGHFTMGYTAPHVGSASMPHFFIDGISIYYVGELANPSLMGLKAALDVANTAVGKKFNKELRAKLQTAIDTAQKLVDAESEDEAANIAAANAINEVMADVNKSVTAYNKLDDFINGALDEAYEKYGDETIYADLSKKLSDLQDDLNDAYQSETYTAEQINDVIASFDAMIKDGVKTAWDAAVASGKELDDDLDISILFGNLEWNPGSTPAYETASGVSQGWSGSTFTVNVSSTLKELPAGTYTIVAKGFYRSGDNANNYDEYNDGAITVKGYVFAGAAKTELANAAELAVYEKPATGAWSEVEGVFIPNDKAAAGSIVADAANDGIVQKAVKSVVVNNGGELVFGFTSDELPGNSWVVWSTEVSIYYNAVDADVLSDELEQLIATAQSYAEDYADDMNGNASTKLEDAIRDAEDVEGGEIEEMSAAITALQAALDYAKTNVADMNALQEAINALNDAYSDYSDTASADALNEYDKVDTESADTDDLTNEEIEDLTKRIYYVIKALKVPAYDGASDSNPIDMTQVIENADFELNGDNGTTDVPGWSYTASGVDKNAPKVKTGAIAGERSTEFWGGTPANIKFNLYQTLSALPAGTYELTASAVSAQVDTEAEGYVALYAQTSGGATSSKKVDVRANTGEEGAYGEESEIFADAKKYSVIFTIKDKEDVTVGFMSVDTLSTKWFICDDFTLTYYGASSSKEVTPDEGDIVVIDGINAEATEVKAIYTVSGAKVSSLQKGINIVKYADGKVVKVLVK